MVLNKNQQQKGYISIATLAFILGAIVLLTFVIEFGRMLIVSAQVENGIELASSAGVYNYGKVLKEETKKEYELAKIEATLEVEAEIAASGIVLTPEEKKELIKQKTKEKMQPKIPLIKSAALSACNSKVSQILQENQVLLVNHTCSSTTVYVKGKKLYTPRLPNIKTLVAKDIVREVKKKIVILSN